MAVHEVLVLEVQVDSAADDPTVCTSALELCFSELVLNLVNHGSTVACD